MLVLTGVSYTSRLWCILEMFVYVSIRDADEQASPDVIVLAGNDCEHQAVLESWAHFDVEHCNCFVPHDKQRIMAAIHHEEDEKAKATLARTLRLETMVELRAHADAAEAVVPADLWTLATYKDLLFLDANQGAEILDAE